VGHYIHFEKPNEFNFVLDGFSAELTG